MVGHNVSSGNDRRIGDGISSARSRAMSRLHHHHKSPRPESHGCLMDP